MLNKILSQLEDQEIYNFYNDFDKKYKNISRQNNSRKDKDLLILCENSRRNKPWLADCL